MIVISNTSPLITLSRINELHIFKKLFGKLYIPDIVYHEAVVQSNDPVQKKNMLTAIGDFIIIETPQSDHAFTRTIDSGERGVINLAFDKKSAFLIIDDRKAGNEAKELGFKVVKTSTLLKRAEKMGIIASYAEVIKDLEKLLIYLPR